MEVVKLIALGKDKYVMLDADDYEKFNHLSWHYNSVGNSGYARDGKEHKYLHRMILDAPKGKEVDHINRDTLDCRKSNMRICDRSKNTFNHPKRKCNTSGHVGVWFRKSDKKWAAEIMLNYKKKCLGSFEKIEDAIAARKAAEAEYFPNFKRTE